MSASTFALGSFSVSFSSVKLNKSIKTTEATSTTITNNQNKHEKLPCLLLVQEKERSGVLFGRREAIGLSFCFGIINGVVQQSSAAEAQCELTATPSGLAYCDRVIGTGSQASKGQLIKAHYLGKLDNGKVFDSSYSRGKPLTFRVGVGEVIKGWDQGILGGEGIPPMLAGGKRTLKIPPELGYGMRGAGCRGATAAMAIEPSPAPSEETLSNIPQMLSGECASPTDCKKARIQRPKSRKAESCTIKCVTTCIRGGAGSPGEGPLNARRPLVVFKQGFRSRQYCLVECSDICNLIKDGEDGP